MQASIYANKKDYDKKMKKCDSEFFDIKTLLEQIMVHNHNSSPENVDSPRAQDPDTMVPSKKKYPSLEGGKYVNWWHMYSQT